MYSILSALCSEGYKRICWVLLLCFCVLHSGRAQKPVSSIYFSGLHKPKHSDLSRYILQQPNEEWDAEQFQEDLQRLKNLTSITDVSYRLDTTANGIDLTIIPEEALTLFPIVLFGGIKDNVWIQVGATDLYLFGRGIQATAIFRINDNRHNGQVYV